MNKQKPHTKNNKPETKHRKRQHQQQKKAREKKRKVSNITNIQVANSNTDFL